MHIINIQRFVKSLSQVSEFLKTNHDESVDIIAKRLNTTTDDVEKRLTEVQILDLQKNIIAMKDSDSLDSLMLPENTL